MHTYLQTEKDPPLYTVGFYDPSGKFQPESDHSDENKAARRASFLNGGPSDGAPSGNGTRETTASGTIELIEQRAQDLGALTAMEQDLEDDRPAKKREAILRLMEIENPLTKKQHSASSAEAVVETDPEYLAHRRAQSAGIVERMRAQGKYDAAKLRAKLAVELMGGDV